MKYVHNSSKGHSKRVIERKMSHFESLNFFEKNPWPKTQDTHMYFWAVVIAFRAAVKITIAIIGASNVKRSSKRGVEFLMRQTLNGRGKGRKRVRDTPDTSLLCAIKG